MVAMIVSSTAIQMNFTNCYTVFYVYGTAQGVETQIAGGLGSDTLIIAPQDTMVVVEANDGKGYSSVMELSINPATANSYQSVKIQGLSVK
jgi:hypothetical protein